MEEDSGRLQAVLAAVERFSVCSTESGLGEALLEQLNTHVGIGGASLYVVRDQHLHLASHHESNHAPKKIALPLGDASPLAQCMRRGAPLLLDERSWNRECQSSGWRGYTHDEALLVPLFDHTQSVSGVVSLHNKTNPPFTPEDVDTARLLVAVASESLRSIQSHQVVQENERRMSSLLRHLPGMAYRCPDFQHWQMEFLSEGCLTLTGYAPQALMGGGEKTYGDLIHPQDRTRIEKRIADAIERGQVFEMAYRIQAQDGRERWVWHKGSGHMDAQTGRVAMDGFVTDITEQHASERRLSRIAMALDQASEAVLITDLRGYPSYANQAMKVMFGFDQEDAPQLHRSAMRVVVPEAHPSHRTLLDCEQKGRPCKVELPFFSCSGHRMELRVQLAPLRDKEGQLTHRVYLISDVSEEHKLKSQLLQAQKMEAIGSLASGIAHEINTPTQYIGDNLRFVKECEGALGDLLRWSMNAAEAPETACVLAPWRAKAETADLNFLLEEIPKALDEALEGNRRVAEIVRAMKAFAHPDDEDFHEENLNDALQAAGAVARNEWKYVAELEFDLQPGLPHVPCQLGALNQVFLNLIVNAAHAVGEQVARENRGGRGKIVIRTRLESPWAVLEFIDTGAGIPEKIRSKIFDPFFTTKGVGKGTGQGLALCHAVVVEQHGGLIDLDSEPGHGSTFTLRLPLQRSFEASE